MTALRLAHLLPVLLLAAPTVSPALAARQRPPHHSLHQAAVFDTYRYVGPRTKSNEAWLQTQEAKLSGARAPDPSSGARKAGTTKAGSAPE